MQKLFVKSLVKTINNICPNTVTDKGNQILLANKSIYVGGGIDKVGPINLLNDLKSYGLSDNAAKGVVANAFGESGFNVKAKGDSGRYGEGSNRSINIDGKKYLYQYRIDEEDGDFEWFHDEHGFNYVDGEIPEKLGITQMGLKFSDIIDMFFNDK